MVSDLDIYKCDRTDSKLIFIKSFKIAVKKYLHLLAKQMAHMVI